MALYRLGNLYLNNGKLDEAKKMYQWALQGLEKAGSDHQYLTRSTVWANAHQGKLAEAEKMYQRVMQGYEKVWGPDYKSSLVSQKCT